MSNADETYLKITNTILINQFNSTSVLLFYLLKMTQISLGDFENGYSEVYLQKTEETHNIVWKEELLPQYQHLAHSSTDKEWSQIFDLGDTVCVW